MLLPMGLGCYCQAIDPCWPHCQRHRPLVRVVQPLLPALQPRRSIRTILMRVMCRQRFVHIWCLRAKIVVHAVTSYGCVMWTVLSQIEDVIGKLLDGLRDKVLIWLAPRAFDSCDLLVWSTMIRIPLCVGRPRRASAASPCDCRLTSLTRSSEGSWNCLGTPLLACIMQCGGPLMHAVSLDVLMRFIVTVT